VTVNGSQWQIFSDRAAIGWLKITAHFTGFILMPKQCNIKSHAGCLNKQSNPRASHGH
jgi:hypothetical protein